MEVWKLPLSTIIFWKLRQPEMGKNTHFPLIVVLLQSMTMITSCLQVSESLNSRTDKAALVMFKSQLVLDADSILAKNWSEPTNHCNWVGVFCGRRHDRVTALVLPSMDLRGTIARDIGNLSFLVSFNIRANSFYGHVPEELGRLKRLRSLIIGGNQLSGNIPASFGFLSNLRVLNTAENNLSGKYFTSWVQIIHCSYFKE